LLSVYSKNKLESTLNFERLVSSFKGQSSQKKKEKERRKRWRGVGGSLSEPRWSMKKENKNEGQPEF
jgi:hypothetical protein